MTVVRIKWDHEYSSLLQMQEILMHMWGENILQMLGVIFIQKVSCEVIVGDHWRVWIPGAWSDRENQQGLGPVEGNEAPLSRLPHCSQFLPAQGGGRRIPLLGQSREVSVHLPSHIPGTIATYSTYPQGCWWVICTFFPFSNLKHPFKSWWPWTWRKKMCLHSTGFTSFQKKWPTALDKEIHKRKAFRNGSD